MSKEIIQEYYVVKYGRGYIGCTNYKTKAYKQLSFRLAEKGTYEEANKLAKVYNGKVKKVTAYIEDVEE